MRLGAFVDSTCAADAHDQGKGLSQVQGPDSENAELARVGGQVGPPKINVFSKKGNDAALASQRPP